MQAERSLARNWYWWLWLSPLITIPTLLAVFAFSPGSRIVCSGQGRCNWDLAGQLSLVIAVLFSSLWHLILLKPISDKSAPFVRYNGRYALTLAGVRTAAALLFVIIFGFDWGALLAIPALILIWFIGTLDGQYQATKGRCRLAGVWGSADEIAAYSEAVTPQPRKVAPSRPASPRDWVESIRFSKDPEVRRQALVELELRRLVEEL